METELEFDEALDLAPATAAANTDRRPEETTPEVERPPTILIADDEKPILRALATLFRRKSWSVFTATDGAEALSMMESARPDVVLSDLRMPSLNGLELLGHLKRRHPDVEVIIMTAYATVDWAVRAVKEGAYDFVTKPFEDVEQVALRVEKALERKRLVDQTRQLRRALDDRDQFEGIVGASNAMRELYAMIDSVSYSDATVLIQGESGTGKELVARAIHYRSPRRDRPFLAINCSALTETLLESELFGHVKGAFTGATQTKRGLFEAASGGTLFLDEVGDLSPMTQVKLLRVLQEGELRRVGSNDTVNVDVRTVAATNVDLNKAMADGSFREDLYYRLNVINLMLPPLRDRVEDIPLLAHHFLKNFSKRLHKQLDGFSPEVMQTLQSYRWVGNVRELENVVERSVVLERGDQVSIESLPVNLREQRFTPNGSVPFYADMPFRRAKELAVQNFERQYVQTLLSRCDSNISEASRRAGMDRSNFRRVIKKHGLQADGE